MGGNCCAQLSSLYYQQKGILEQATVCTTSHAFQWSLTRGDESNIAAFDIQREEFCTRPLPGLGGSADSYRNLGVLGHCLCLVSMHVHSSVDMQMTKENGINNSWAKLLSPDHSTSLLRIWLLQHIQRIVITSFSQKCIHIQESLLV